jgi:hypothetical protein
MFGANELTPAIEVSVTLDHLDGGANELTPARLREYVRLSHGTGSLPCLTNDKGRTPGDVVPLSLEMTGAWRCCRLMTGVRARRWPNQKCGRGAALPTKALCLCRARELGAPGRAERGSLPLCWHFGNWPSGNASRQGCLPACLLARSCRWRVVRQASPAGGALATGNNRR